MATGGLDQAGPGPRKPLPDSLGRPPGYGGKLRRFEPMHVAEDQKRAIIRVERALKQVAQGQQLEIVALARLGTLDETLESTAKAAASAECGQGTITRDTEQPRLRILDLAKLVAAAERLVEAVLEQVLGKRTGADHLREETAESRLAGVEQILDSLGRDRGHRAFPLAVLPRDRLSRLDLVTVRCELAHLTHIGAEPESSVTYHGWFATALGIPGPAQGVSVGAGPAQSPATYGVVTVKVGVVAGK